MVVVDLLLLSWFQWFSRTEVKFDDSGLVPAHEVVKSAIVKLAELVLHFVA